MPMKTTSDELRQPLGDIGAVAAHGAPDAAVAERGGRPRPPRSTSRPVSYCAAGFSLTIM